MPYLLAVGACYLDTILNVSHYPCEDEKLRASSIMRRRGGNCPNTVEVLDGLLLARRESADFCVALLSVLPSRSSQWTDQICASFGPLVDLSHCIYREGCEEPASSYIFRSQATDSRTIVNYNELPEMTVEEFIAVVDEIGQELTWCHFEGRIPEVTMQCIRYLRHRFGAIKISVEVEKPAREGLQGLAAETDVVFYSKSWALDKGYKTAEECLLAQVVKTPNASLLCCTWGSEGASALSPGSDCIHCPASKHDGASIVDTIGAGDTFIAGMLYGLISRAKDWDLARKLEFATRLAGLKVLQEGFSGLGKRLQDGR